MAVLTAKMTGDDGLSKIFERISASGAKAVQEWREAGNVATAAFSNAEDGADNAAKAMHNATESSTALREAVTENKESFTDMGNAAKDAGEDGADAITQIKTTLATAGIVVMIKQIKGAVIDMTNEFSRAEAVIVRSTGATGAELAALRENMFNVHAMARSGNLAATAAAVSEVNTRFRIQGDELERVTSLFMDYADMNNTYVAGSIRTVSQLMTRWNIEATETEWVLDRLTFVSQQTGAAVDNLAYQSLRYQSVMEALNFDLNESLALFAALEAGGINASSVMYGLRRSVIYLTRDGGNARDGLMEVIDEIKNMSSAASATALAVEMFGVRAGPDMANAIRAGKLEIEEWVAALEGADGTLASTAANATTLEERWTQASNSMNTAFSRVLGPSLENVSGLFADLKMGAAMFLNDHPWLVGAITGLGTALIITAGAVTAVTFAKTVAIPKIKAFGLAVHAAMGPIGWITLAITALIAVVAGIAMAVGNADSEFRSLTSTSQQHYTEVRRLRREYERATLTYGEHSAAARQLRGELEGAQGVFEANRRTWEEFRAENARVVDNARRTIDSHRETSTAITEQYRTTDALIHRYNELYNITNRTAGQEQEKISIMNRLTGTFGHLGVRIDNYTGSLNRAYSELINLNTAQEQYARISQYAEDRVDLVSREIELTYQLADALRENQAANAQWNEGSYGTRAFWFGVLDAGVRRQRGRINDSYNDWHAINNELQEVRATISDIDDTLSGTNVAAVGGFAAVESAVNSVSGRMLNLIARYEDLRESALESVQSQFTIWERAESVVAVSTSSIIANLQSQIEFFASYRDNLATVREMLYGVEGADVILEKLASGSQEAMGLAMYLAGSTQERVAEFAGTFATYSEELAGVHESVASEMASAATDFDNAANEIFDSMKEFIGDMTMENEARIAAESTMNAYLAEIRGRIGEARSLGRSVGAAFASGLGGPSGLGLTVSGFASGTPFAPPGLAWVGEEGPELVNFRGGERVYSHPESIRIVTEAPPIDTSGITFPEFPAPASYGSPLKSERTITLNIAGRGQIEVNGNMDEDAVWDFIEPKLKPAVMGMMREEIYEEGNDSYEF